MAGHWRCFCGAGWSAGPFWLSYGFFLQAWACKARSRSYERGRAHVFLVKGASIDSDQNQSICDVFPLKCRFWAAGNDASKKTICGATLCATQWPRLGVGLKLRLILDQAAAFCRDGLQRGSASWPLAGVGFKLLAGLRPDGCVLPRMIGNADRCPDLRAGLGFKLRLILDQAAALCRERSATRIGKLASGWRRLQAAGGLFGLTAALCQGSSATLIGVLTFGRALASSCG